MTPPRGASLTDVSLQSVPSCRFHLSRRRGRGAWGRRVVNGDRDVARIYVSAFDGVVPRSA